jgi:response regulator NasT
MEKRVVIADDESIIRLDLKEILESDGYLVVGEAARGDDALAQIQEHRPDLALLDVKMPGLDGIEVARAVKDSSTVVVLLTAFSQRSLIENARDAGVARGIWSYCNTADFEPFRNTANTHDLVRSWPYGGDVSSALPGNRSSWPQRCPARVCA